MKGMLFKPAIWEAKKRVLEQYGLAVTRRVIKLDPLGWDKPFSSYDKTWGFHRKDTGAFGAIAYAKPLYQVGEVVYIKEAWETEKQYDDLPPRLIPQTARIWYIPRFLVQNLQNLTPCGKWRSPLFMPAWAARDHIKFTDVRAERLENPLPATELILEGGVDAIPLLILMDGIWVFRYGFVPSPKE